LKVEFFRHNIGPKEIRRVNGVLRSVFLTTGEVVREFEDDFAAYLGCKHTVGVTSCTAGLHLSLQAYGVGPGDEVITTPMSFIATANSILHAGAKPVFVDVEPDTGNINADLIEKAVTPRTKAIMPVHLYGQMCDMKKIKEIADRHGLVIIEDAAHCVEGLRDGIKPGQLSHAACFSFYATKNLASGEGGAIVTNDPSVADKLRVLRLHGMTKGASDRYHGRYRHWDMELLGWKYNMDNIHAALLVDQLKLLDRRLKRRQKIARTYEKAFKEMGIGFPKALRVMTLRGGRHARHLFTIWAPPAQRDGVLGALQERGVGVAVNFRAMHLLKFYRELYSFKEGDFPVAETIGASTISIPLYPKLTDEEAQYVIESVRAVMEGLRRSS